MGRAYLIVTVGADQQQRGVAARGVPYSIIARGGDTTTGTRGDDNRLRWFWDRWREMMGVELNSLAGELDGHGLG